MDKRTPPGALPRYVAAFPRSPNVELVMLSGGDPVPGGDPCTVPGPHYFLGIEDEVLAAIAGWIKAQRATSEGT